MNERTTRNDKFLRWSEYFLRAHYMFEVVEKMKNDLSTGYIEREGLSSYFLTHLELWLALLYVSVEGYQELNLKCDKIDELIPLNIEYLGRYRNEALHFNVHLTRTGDFLDTKPNGELSLNWAQELHISMREFILDYCTREDVRIQMNKKHNFAFNARLRST